MVVAEWTGEYPCLCCGEWRLTIGGVDWSNAIPIDKRYSHMNTAGTYQEWHFEDWQEVFEDYEDGLEFDEWILAFESAVKALGITHSERPSAGIVMCCCANA